MNCFASEIIPGEGMRLMVRRKAEGVPFENYADYEADKRKAFNWDTIGIGRI